MSTPDPDTIQIYVGTDRSQRIGLQVLEYSISKTCSRPFKVHSLEHVRLPEPQDKRQVQRTGFSFSRFAIPRLASYQGKAIYMDADMLVFKDIAELWDTPFEQHKMLIQAEVPSASPLRANNRRNQNGVKRSKQCSVALLDCKALAWVPEDIIAGLDGEYDYAQLMSELCILSEDELGYSIPPEWNSLEHWDENTGNIHYTDMQTQPWVSPANPFGYLWLDTVGEMLQLGLLSRQDLELEIESGFARPSLLAELDDRKNGRSQSSAAYEKIDRDAGFVKHRAVYEAKRKREQAEKAYLRSLRASSGAGPLQSLWRKLHRPANDALNANRAETRPAADPLRILFVANSDNLPTLQLAFTHALKNPIAEGRIVIDVLSEYMIGDHSRIRLARKLSQKTYVDQRLKQFRPDVVAFCRYSGLMAEYILQSARRLGARTLCCIDDDLLNVPKEIGEQKFHYYRDENRRNRIRYLLDNADLVYSSTQPLSDCLKRQQIAAPIVTAEVFCPTLHISKPVFAAPQRIGYMGFGHEQDFQLALPAITQLLRERPGLEFELFGTIARPAELQEFGSRVRSIEANWNYAEFLQQLAARQWRIGICPLAELPFNEFKCSTKWLEYTSVGAAVVASDHSVYRSVIAGQCGEQASSTAGWTQAMEKLLDDDEYRLQIVGNAQAKARQQFSETAFLAQFEQCLHKLQINSSVQTSRALAA